MITTVIALSFDELSLELDIQSHYGSSSSITELSSTSEYLLADNKRCSHDSSKPGTRVSDAPEGLRAEMSIDEEQIMRNRMIRRTKLLKVLPPPQRKIFRVLKRAEQPKNDFANILFTPDVIIEPLQSEKRRNDKTWIDSRSLRCI